MPLVGDNSKTWAQNCGILSETELTESNQTAQNADNLQLSERTNTRVLWVVRGDLVNNNEAGLA